MLRSLQRRLAAAAHVSTRTQMPITVPKIIDRPRRTPLHQVEEVALLQLGGLNTRSQHIAAIMPKVGTYHEVQASHQYVGSLRRDKAE